MQKKKKKKSKNIYLDFEYILAPRSKQVNNIFPQTQKHG